MLVSQIPWGLLFLLLRGCVGAPLNGPCGDHEERACLPCHEPTCSYPFVSEPNCRFLALCHLGCGCSFGFLRDDDTNRCVPNHQCDTSQRPLPLQPAFRNSFLLRRALVVLMLELNGFFVDLNGYNLQ